MKINELRIGNYLASNYFDDRIVILQVKEIRESQIIALNKENNTISPYLYNNEVKPIKLTEEILLKCGFNKNEIGGYIMYTELGSMLCVYKDGSFRSNERYIDTKIKHLHQLQNLYFSLTGKELEVEL